MGSVHQTFHTGMSYGISVPELCHSLFLAHECKGNNGWDRRRVLSCHENLLWFPNKILLLKTVQLQWFKNKEQGIFFIPRFVILWMSAVHDANPSMMRERGRERLVVCLDQLSLYGLTVTEWILPDTIFQGPFSALLKDVDIWVYHVLKSAKIAIWWPINIS